MKTKALINVILVIMVLLFCVISPIAQAQDLDEFKKETIASIREITLQLILLATGIFALFGSFIITKERDLRKRPLIWTAFISLAISVVMGLLTYGNLIWGLGKRLFDPFGNLETLAMLQWIFFFIGGSIFGLFVLLNIKRQ
jgi:predicted MFS family arabinose efflux permease